VERYKLLFLLMTASGRFFSFHEGLRSADSVEKVGHGFHGRQVSA
jgi:hypothetical protein